ncbi:NUDIX hydrolase [Halostagnicola larsenii XH-48]|uniref:NUDIX hydrolase n=1 Tax=Halostagnicola larsenii XH-48 TaxID=797299 RepID=W0JNI0_9EURY|nr:NUDIX hydrolase [Halostagnicola larsenii]AHF98836.1 NUDIX hydrolase [Halostagnicola larsenii XH-48]
MTDDSLSWETIDSTVAYSCPGFEIVNETVQLPDGTETDFDYLTEPPSVCILPLTPDGEVVCIEEWRQAVSRVNYGLPAGGTESDDVDLEAAARRELREETGYEADRLESLVSVEPANGFADAVIHFFVARGCRPTAAQRLDHDESIRVTTPSLEELTDAVADGALRDGRVVLALSYYRLFAEDRDEE